MFRSLVTAVAAAAAIVALSAPPAAAQPLDERVFFTFKEPVAVPGTVLQPGEYVFRLADPLGNRKVVQVLTADFRSSVALFMTNETTRRDPANAFEVTFGEAQAGSPRPIDALWVPGSVYGKEPVYHPSERSWNRTERALGANANGN